MTPDAQVKTGIRVWDLPTRLFHWLLVVLIVLLYATGEFGMLDMRWHFWLGYATLALTVFRVSWGLFGSQTSRFADFVRGPAAVGRYVKAQISTNAHFSLGHNPLGGWSVLANRPVTLCSRTLSSSASTDQPPRGLWPKLKCALVDICAFT
jgi:cytochrome b